MIILIVCIAAYFLIGAAAGIIFGEPSFSPGDCVIILFIWPLIFIEAIIQRTAWYKRYKRRKKIKVTIIEENESEESIIEKLKRF